ncbi:type IV secretion system protein [Roseibium algae]|uniref:Type IV secretion system protein n=1 Tax=Roseibium algae TaxID=3123038 RepID=A0ABU8TRV6_9HYPH
MADPACNICLIFTAYESHAEASLNTLISAVHGPVQVLALAIAGIWIVWVGVQATVGTLDLAGALKQIFFLVLGFGCYMGLNSGLIGEVYKASVNVMGGLSSTVMGNGASGLSGMSSLLSSVEQGIGGVFKIGMAIMGAGGWSEVIQNTAYGVALLLPYVILLILFLSHTAVSLFRLTLILGVSPFLVAMAAFPFGRGLVVAGVRTIVGSIITMLCVSVVFSLVIGSVEALGVTGDDKINVAQYINLGTGDFLLALIMGWLGAALVSEAVNIAGQVSSSVLGTVSAGIMSAGAMRGGSMGVSAGRMAAGAAGRVGGMMHEKTWSSDKPRPGDIIQSSRGSGGS